MKKILLMLTMVLVLGFSAICSASNGKVLDAEEAMVNKFLAASNYSAVTSMMTDGMKKDFTEEVFKNFKEIHKCSCVCYMNSWINECLVSFFIRLKSSYNFTKS